MNDDHELRNQLIRMLTARQAHMDFEDAVADFPASHNAYHTGELGILRQVMGLWP